MEKRLGVKGEVHLRGEKAPTTLDVVEIVVTAQELLVLESDSDKALVDLCVGEENVAVLPHALHLVLGTIKVRRCNLGFGDDERREDFLDRDEARDAKAAKARGNHRKVDGVIRESWQVLVVVVKTPLAERAVDAVEARRLDIRIPRRRGISHAVIAVDMGADIVEIIVYSFAGDESFRRQLRLLEALLENTSVELVEIDHAVVPNGLGTAGRTTTVDEEKLSVGHEERLSGVVKRRGVVEALGGGVEKKIGDLASG